eukprot:1158008-Pelagomonas_calceolata.AAC.11
MGPPKKMRINHSSGFVLPMSGNENAGVLVPTRLNVARAACRRARASVFHTVLSPTKHIFCRAIVRTLAPAPAHTTQLSCSLTLSPFLPHLAIQLLQR